MFLKRFFPRTVFSLTPSSSSSPYSIFIAQCSTSPFHLTYPHSHSHPDPRNVRVSVWWDLENCDMPSGLNVLRGTQAITAAIESSGIKGPIQISAFGDMLRHQEALSSTGIKLTHAPHVGEDSADRSIFRDLMYWVSKNPPPAHLFLITVDGGSTSLLHRVITDKYASLLHRLRMDNYNILLASKRLARVVDVLSRAATIMWDWDALVRGENLTGRYFNQPPNGSWYGHYEVPLEYPCTEIEGEVLQRKSPEKPHEVFSQESFWTDLKTFIHTDIGSLIVAESTSRKKLAYYLRKYGPPVLKSVPKSDVLRMVNILLTHKPWVFEDPYGIRPFQLSSCDSVSKFADSDDDFSDSE